MSLLWGRPRPAETRSTSLAQLLEEARGVAVIAEPERVTPQTALYAPGVWTAASLVASLLSTLPIHVYRGSGADRVTVDRADTVLGNPSAAVDELAWFTQVVLSAVLRNNAVGVIVDRDRRGFPTQVEMIDPDAATVTRDGRYGPLRYRVDGQPVDADDVWHLRAMVLPGNVVGADTIELARQSISVGLAAAKYGAQFFAGGGHPSAILSTSADVNEAAAKTIKRRFLQSLRVGQPAILGKGMTYTPVQTTPEDAQLLDTRVEARTEAALYYRVPPEMVGGAVRGSAITYANVEQRFQFLASVTLAPWAVVLERALTRLLPAGHYARLNVDAIVRADLATRYAAHERWVRSGLGTVDERRALEDVPPLPDDQGNRVLWPPYASTLPPGADPNPPGGR